MKKTIFLFIAVCGIQKLNAQALAASMTNVINASCNSLCNGSALCSVTGGTGPYTYSWAPNGSILAQATGLCAGTYTCTVTDAVMATTTATCTIAQPMALSISFSTTSASCNSGNGNITANWFGGTPPYTCNWQPGNFVTPTISSTAGTYTCTITDANACTVTGTVVLTQPAPITVPISTTSATCGNMNGAATANPLGGTSPYYFSWQPTGQTTQTATGLVAGSYTCTVTDANGCVGTGSAIVANTGGPSSVLSSSSNISCFGAGDGSATVTTTGGTTPYTYQWSPSGGNGATASALTPQSYTCLITDANGCINTVTVQITEPSQLVAAVVSFIPAGCNNSDGSAVASFNGGTPPYSYQWLTYSSNVATLSNVPNGTYYFTVDDANACHYSTSVVIGDSCNYVWPGDANEDAVADNNDVLAIGIANGATGTTRANATTSWIGQPSTDWGQTFLSGTDYKFADCDGNGIIQPVDTNAVIQNFGFTHNMRLNNAPVYDATLPDLTVTMNQSQIGSGNSGSLSVALGSSANPANNVYGVAFTLNFDPSLIDATSFGMNNSNCWMGTVGTDLMGVVLRPSASSGFVEVAITRLDHNNASGNGNIADLGFTTTNALMGTFQNEDVVFSISNVTIIESNETTQQVNIVNDTVNVCDPGVLGVNDNSHSSFTLYPNPVNENVTITLPENFSGKNCQVILTDATGRIVSEESFNTTTRNIRLETLSSGIYFCNVIVDGRSIGVKKLVKE